ncbi:unnamed protein product [Effrenium voratum]|nr:unnamed protein product [Effrenium voratum]
MAIKYACGTWLLMVVVLVARSGITGLGGSCLLLPCLVYLPMIVLLLVFLLGHQIVGETPSLWVDKLCIHQTDPDLKAEQIAALAVFVARSQRMLILWDDTYFERLWCNLELATHARFCGAEKVEVLPLWLAPWLLASILLDILGVTLFFQLEPVFPKWSEAVTRYAAAMLGETRGGSYFVACFAVWLMSSIVYLPISIPCFFSFRMKLRSHQLMLNQMAAFDVKNAKCSLPADREPITQHVRELFRDRDGREEDAKVTGDVDAGEVCLQNYAVNYFPDPLQRFNVYVRGKLRDSVIAQIGDELFVPWRTCLIAFLPMILYSSANVLGCDNAPCEISFRLQGFRSASECMITNAAAWVLCITLAFPLTYPILLRMLKLIFSFGDGVPQHVAAFLCCPLAFMYNYICGGLIWASLIPLVLQYSVNKLLFFLLVLVVLSVQLAWLFSGHIRQRNEMSCRCTKRYEAVSGNSHAT